MKIYIVHSIWNSSVFHSNYSFFNWQTLTQCLDNFNSNIKALIINFQWGCCINTSYISLWILNMSCHSKERKTKYYYKGKEKMDYLFYNDWLTNSQLILTSLIGTNVSARGSLVWEYILRKLWLFFPYFTFSAHSAECNIVSRFERFIWKLQRLCFLS